MTKLPRLIRLFLDAKGRRAFDQLQEDKTPPALKSGNIARSKLARLANATAEETATIREALDAASKELDRFEEDGTATEREKLIRKAVTIHRSKQQALEDLTPQDRARLHLLAQAVLTPKKK